jgi:hypothetical protein
VREHLRDNCIIVCHELGNIFRTNLPPPSLKPIGFTPQIPIGLMGRKATLAALQSSTPKAGPRLSSYFSDYVTRSIEWEATVQAVVVRIGALLDDMLGSDVVVNSLNESPVMKVTDNVRGSVILYNFIFILWSSHSSTHRLHRCHHLP